MYIDDWDDRFLSEFSPKNNYCTLLLSFLWLTFLSYERKVSFFQKALYFGQKICYNV